MVRVLHELASLDGGGVAKLLYDYYSHMEDKADLKFDFLIYDFYEDGIYEEPLRRMGCQIYKIPAFKKDRKASLKALKKVISRGNYDAVHSHRCTRGVFALWYAWRCGVKRRIIHSHIAYEAVGKMAGMVNRTLALINRGLATDLFACGNDAAAYMWGKERLASGRVHIMTNAIDTDLFRFDPAERERQRKKLGIGDDEYVVGIVGRLNKQKNQAFLLEVFAEILKKEKKAVLLLAGRGEEEERLKKLGGQLQLGDRVRFLGIRNDIPLLSNAFDLYVLPSLYEGLPVSAVEAQANGLRTLISENVTREVKITDLAEYLPLEKEAWVSRILFYMAASAPYDRGEYAAKVAEAGYDIKKESRKMQEYYIHGKWEDRQE